jgi:hypothetical protein
MLSVLNKSIIDIALLPKAAENGFCPCPPGPG